MHDQDNTIEPNSAIQETRRPKDEIEAQIEQKRRNAGLSHLEPFKTHILNKKHVILHQTFSNVIEND